MHFSQQQKDKTKNKHALFENKKRAEGILFNLVEDGSLDDDASYVCGERGGCYGVQNTVHRNCLKRGEKTGSHAFWRER